MNNFNFQDCRKAVNQASFRPTKSRKALASKLLAEALEFVANLEEVADKPSKKAKKTRRKTRKKATPTQRVADKQEKAFHGKADSPVKPSKKAKTASVEAAKASLKEMDEKKAVKKSAKLKAKAVASGVNEVDRVASLEAKIEALTAVLAVHMETTSLASPSNEVSLDQLPF